jgi:hypothetical protein
MHNLTRRGLPLVILVATIFALSCESENNNVEVADLPADYFPLKKGMFQIYDVHETVYTLGVPTENNYQLKTTVVDSIDNGNGTYNYVQYHYKRAAGSQTWTYASTWSAQTDTRELVVNEANTVYLKYRFPLSAGYTWNGNAYNNLGEDAYVMEGAKVSQAVGGIAYDDCLVINQHDSQDFIVFFDQRKETYARGVGLLSKSVRQYHYCTDTDAGCLGQQVIEEGIDYTQTLVSHGRE